MPPCCPRCCCAAGPGEQRRRHYDWRAAGIDPATHSFGLKARDGVRDGVSKCLAPGLDEGQEQVRGSRMARALAICKMLHNGLLVVLVDALAEQGQPANVHAALHASSMPARSSARA